MLGIYSVVLAAVFLQSNGQKVNYAKNYVVEAHQNVTISCEEVIPILVTIFPSDSEMIWRVEGENSDEWTKVTAARSGTSVLDCTRRKVPDCFSGPVLSLLRLQNVSSSNSGTYTCYTKSNGRETLIQESHLTVGYPPKEPLLLENGCTLRIMRDMMTCCWKIQNATYVKTNYSMTYKPDGGLTKSTKCSIISPVCCEINVANHYIVYEIYLTSKNVFGNSTSVKHRILPSWHIKSEPPRNIHLETKVHGTVSIINASWSRPNQTFASAFEYKIRIADAKTKTWTTEFGNKQTRHILEPLRSSTLYSVQVSARPVSIHGVNKGVWSDWSETVSIRTKVAAPSKNLYFSRSNTTTMSLDGKRYFVVDLKWSPYGNEKEEGFASKIICEAASEKKSFAVRNGTTVRFSTTAAEVLCKGAYCNVAGCSESDAIRKTHQNIPESVENVKVISLNKTALSFMWDSFSSKGACTAKVCYRQRSVTDEVQPQSEPQRQCVFDKFHLLQVEHINCLSGTFTISRDLDPCFSYAVIIQAFYERNELLVQSNPSDIIQYNPNVGRISEFRASDTSSLHVPRIDVTWHDSHLVPNFHMQPQLWYQAIDGSECSGKIEATCGKTFYARTEPDATSISISDNVYGGTHYNVGYRFVCNRNTTLKHSGMVDSDTFSLEADGARTTVITAQTAPTSPRDLTVSKRIGARQTLLVWQPPFHGNGHTFYDITKMKDFDPKTVSTHRTTEENLAIDVSCPPAENGTKFSFVVTAMNRLANGSLLMGGNATMENISCLSVTDSSSRSNTAVILASVCASVLASLLLAFFLYYHRDAVKRQLWTPAPKPTLTNHDVVPLRGEMDIPEIPREAVTSFESYQPCRKGHGVNSDYLPAAITPGNNDVVADSENEEVSHELLNEGTAMTECTTIQSSSISESCQDGDSLTYTDLEFGSAATSSNQSGPSLIKQYVRMSEPEPTPSSSIETSEYERLEDASTPLVDNEEYVQDSGMVYVMAPSPD